MKAKPCGLVVAIAVVFLLPLSAAAAEESVPVVVNVQDEATDACLDYTPVETLHDQPTLLLGPAEADPAAAGGCKPCKDQPFCRCTYNGMRRVSCDPCCYVNDIGVYTCLS